MSGVWDEVVMVVGGDGSLKKKTKQFFYDKKQLFLFLGILDITKVIVKGDMRYCRFSIWSPASSSQGLKEM